MKIIPLLILCLFWGATASAEILSVTVHTATLRSSPSSAGSLVVVEAPRYYPLQVIGSQDEFVNVRDYQGREGWVPRAEIGLTRGVVVRSAVANVRTGPGERYDVQFQARRGVTFRVIQDQMSWFYVEHESGQTGWIHKNLVWGR
jgi:SH3-like domain-containing protein